MSETRESIPQTISDAIQVFAKDLGARAPVYVSVVPPPDAHIGDRFQNVERQCKLLNGHPVFGRAISSVDDLYLVGEWHCVVSTAQDLIDVTSNAMGETRTLFAAYPDLQDAGELFRPTIRERIYGAAERKAALGAKLSNADDADKITARKNGITVRQLMLSRLPRDPLGAQIDDYLRAEGKLEASIVSAHDGSRSWDPAQLSGLQAEFERLDRRRRQLYDAADRLKNIVGAGNRFR
jgi:hypothetical protein